MNHGLRRLLPADLRGQVAGILFLGLALSQLMAALLYVVLLPGWQAVLRPDVAAARIGMVVRLLESVDPGQRAGFARLWSDRGFRLQYIGTDTKPGDHLATDPRYSALRDDLATELHKNCADVRVQIQALDKTYLIPRRSVWHSAEVARLTSSCQSVSNIAWAW